MSIKIDGLEELEKRLKENVKMNDVKRVVKRNGAELQKKIQSNADFKGHFAWEKGKGKVFKSPTGETKRSVGLEITDDGFTAESGAETEYAPYLEYGTRFMDAQPFIRPAFEEQSKQFQKDLQNLVK